MELIDIINKANNLEGVYLDLGFGKGKDAKQIYNLMLENKIKSRDFILIDLFEGGDKGIWQKAYDLCNEVKNRLKRTGVYLARDIRKEKLSITQPIALVTIDIEEGTEQALNQVLPLVKKGGVVLLKNYNSNNSESIDNTKYSYLVEHINRALQHTNSTPEVVSNKDYSYIIRDELVRPVQKTKIKRTRSILT